MKISNPTARLGENLACEYLQKKGYLIIERNFRQRYGEIDIICTHRNTLIFVEVKTRTSMSYGAPLESITPRKLRELVLTGQFYKLSHRNLPEALRIDAVSILLHPDGKSSTIEHVENLTT